MQGINGKELKIANALKEKNINIGVTTEIRKIFKRKI